MNKMAQAFLFGVFLLVVGGVLFFTQKPKPVETEIQEEFDNITAEKSPGNELTATDLEAFFDGLIPVQIEQADIAGLVLAVAKDGKVFFSKGYGYADRANQVPMTPETTLIRPGSISKLFTWTAVMQLFEQGKIDLDKDINEYLDFKISPAFDRPITMRDLMTHRPGFEEAFKDIFHASAEELRPLPEYLQTHMPARIFPPGKIPAYSNYGTTLAAYIVERVSGKEFNEYVEEYLFKPLDMQFTTFRQPIPEHLLPNMSKGYNLGSEDPKIFEMAQVWPAGSVTTSVFDLTHFMIMNLQNGHYGNSQILKPETAILMHERQPGWPEEMNAMCLGFYEQSQNGYRVIAHRGDTNLFHSNMLLILKPGVGVLISYNSNGKSSMDILGVLFEQFMDRYFPGNRSEAVVEKGNNPNLTGAYWSSRRSETNFMSILSMFTESHLSTDPKDGTISMSGLNGLNGKPIRFEKIGPGLFRDVDGKAKLAFREDSEVGRIVFMDFPVMVFQDVNNLLKKQWFNYFVLGSSLLIIALNLLGWPLGAMVRNHYGKPLDIGAGRKWLRYIVYATCLIIIAFVFIFGFLIVKLLDFTTSAAQIDLLQRSQQIIGVVIGIGALIALFSAAWAWTDRREWIWSKVWSTLVAFACIGFVWLLYNWNFLSNQLKF